MALIIIIIIIIIITEEIPTTEPVLISRTVNRNREKYAICPNYRQSNNNNNNRECIFV